MIGHSDAQGSGTGGADAGTRVSRQAAADVAQVIRGKRWLQRVVEMAEAVDAGAGPDLSTTRGRGARAS